MKTLVTSLTGLLCLMTFSSTVASGAFPAVLPEIARTSALADWQLGIVAGAFGFARMVADIPIGLFLTYHLRRALWLGPLVMASGVLFLTSGGGFWILVLGRLLMGVGQALGIMASITAILRFQTGGSLASSLNANEFAAMIGMLGGTVVIAWLPARLEWNSAFLLTCAPQLLGLVVVPALLTVLPASARAGGTAGRIGFETSDTPGGARPASGLVLEGERRGLHIGRSMVPLAFAAGASVAIAYSTMEQFMIPLRASREFGLERAGVARLLMVTQLFDIAALIPAGLLADRHGTPRVLVVTLLLMATGNALVGFGGLPVVVLGCALFGLAMTGWMLPLSVLRQETAPERIAWRTGLYRVCVDAGMFLGPFLAGLLGTRFFAVLPIAWTAALALTALLLLARARSSGTMTMHG